ncbi:hypothetical protein J6590_053518 [Homalodisca vitripennis]|nr:hypothetical protein J6590_053518 [Homalodisca vitripennis]
MYGRKRATTNTGKGQGRTLCTLPPPALRPTMEISIVVITGASRSRGLSHTNRSDVRATGHGAETDKSAGADNAWRGALVSSAPPITAITGAGGGTWNVLSLGGILLERLSVLFSAARFFHQQMVYL